MKSFQNQRALMIMVVDASMKVLLPRPPKAENSEEKGEKTHRHGDRPRHHNKDHKPKKDFTITQKDSE